MNSAAVRSFVRGEVAEVERDLPDDAIPLWQSSTMLVLVTSEGCRPCELQKQAIPDDVRYHTFDLKYVNEKGYQVDSTPTLMVFVDRKLQEQRSGLLRGDGLHAFLNRWGFRRDGDQPEEGEELHDDDWKHLGIGTSVGDSRFPTEFGRFRAGRDSLVLWRSARYARPALRPSMACVPAASLPRPPIRGDHP